MYMLSMNLSSFFFLKIEKKSNKILPVLNPFSISVYLVK